MDTEMPKMPRVEFGLVLANTQVLTPKVESVLALADVDERLGQHVSERRLQ